MEHFLEHYGYLAVILGVFVQGKSVALAAGIIAHHGELSIVGVLVAVIATTYAYDLILYAVGWSLGHRLYDRRPKWKAIAERLRALLGEQPVATLMAYRFIPGVRIASPAIIGAARYSPASFLPLDAISAALGMGALVLAGFGLGHLLFVLIDRANDYEIAVAVGVVLAGTAFLIHRHTRRRP